MLGSAGALSRLAGGAPGVLGTPGVPGMPGGPGMPGMPGMGGSAEGGAPAAEDALAADPPDAVGSGVVTPGCVGPRNWLQLAM
jgi:hypothetical protein